MSDMQHQIREAAHRFRQRFDQIETIGYDEVKKWLGEVEALARGLPDAPPAGDVAYMPVLVLDDDPEPPAAEPGPAPQPLVPNRRPPAPSPAQDTAPEVPANPAAPPASTESAPAVAVVAANPAPPTVV